MPKLSTSKPAKAPAKAVKKRKLVSFLSVEQRAPFTNFPGFHIKESDPQKVFTPVAVVHFPNAHVKAGEPAYLRQQDHAKLIESAPDLLRAVRHAKEFFDSLPNGSLGAISCDIGALNEFYLTGNPLLKKLEIFE